LTNIHAPPAQGNCRDEFGNTVKPLVIEDYNIHLDYVDKSDRMSTSYGMSGRIAVFLDFAILTFLKNRTFFSYNIFL
jgi:hypothetical protein